MGNRTRTVPATSKLCLQRVLLTRESIDGRLEGAAVFVVESVVE